MKVKVLPGKAGFDNVCMRHEGEVFDLPAGAAKTATWYEVVETAKAEKPGKAEKAEKPETPAA